MSSIILYKTLRVTLIMVNYSYQIQYKSTITLKEVLKQEKIASFSYSLCFKTKYMAWQHGNFSNRITSQCV